MKSKPILFKAGMVNSILAGLKTNTRRVAKNQYLYVDRTNEQMTNLEFTKEGVFIRATNNNKSVKCPYGNVGDGLWVKETYCKWCDEFIYAANESKAQIHLLKWKPSIFMPREASRILLEIKGLRVERLQDISDEDAVKEGIQTVCGGLGYRNYLNPAQYFKIGKEYNGKSAAYASFATLWISINGVESWDFNPWVWVIEFEQIFSSGKLATLETIKMSETNA